MPPKVAYYDSKGRAHRSDGKYTKDTNSTNKKKSNNIKQDGGFVPALVAGLTGAITAGQRFKPATKIQDAIKSQGWDKNIGGKIASGILEVPKLFGFGDNAVLVSNQPNPRKKRLDL